MSDHLPSEAEKSKPELAKQMIWASESHPLDKEGGHLSYGYWADSKYDGGGFDPAGVRYIRADIYDKAVRDAEWLAGALMEIRSLSRLGTTLGLARKTARDALAAYEGEKIMTRYRFRGWWSNDEKDDSPEPWETFRGRCCTGIEAGDDYAHARPIKSKPSLPHPASAF